MLMKIPGKIPIHIHPIFWLLVFLIAGVNSNFQLPFMLIWAVVIFVSVLVHEYGHALTAVAFGQRAHIDLVGFGGLTHRHGPRINLWREFLIVLNGPLAGLALAFVCRFIAIAIGDAIPLLAATFEVGYQANLFWTIVNLVPIQPLDGGHLLRIMLEGAFGLRGVKIALFIGMLVAFAISMLFFLTPYFLIGIFFMMFTFENYRAWKGSLSLTDNDKDSHLQQLLKSAEKDVLKGNDESALQKLANLRRLTEKGVIFITASELMAQIYDHSGRYQEAYAVLKPLKGSLSAEAMALLHKTSYHLGEWQEALALGTVAYQRKPSYEAALLNAFCYGHLGDPKPAVGWLQCAIKEGLPNLREIIESPEFNDIRSDPQFQRLLESV